MRSRLLITILVAGIGLGISVFTIVGDAQSKKKKPPTQKTIPTEKKSPTPAAGPPQAPVTGRQVSCPPNGPLLDVKPSSDPAVQEQQRKDILETINKEGATIRLWAGVDLNFEKNELPLLPGRCVTLTSVDAPTTPAALITTHNTGTVGPLPTTNDPDPDTDPQARNSRSRGPILRFGNPREGVNSFIEIICRPGPEYPVPDGVRISGFQLSGPTWDAQSTNEVGIRIHRCIDIEISNMEIAGWGEAAIKVQDIGGPDQCPDTNIEGGRIASPGQIRIHHNFLHHNQHPSDGDKAAGYGVDVSQGAWAQIDRNVFDFNRHSIAASGDSGGYNAERNLVLKGGGRHGGIGNKYTHSFDVHGTGCSWSKNLCGTAGTQFHYIANSFQFRKDYAIKLRGKPFIKAFIDENVFPHTRLEGALLKEDAIHLNTKDNVEFGRANVTKHDSLGKYEVCDFDGDAIDDLFLATGATWWFSSGSGVQWTYLSAKKQQLNQLRLGYFDNDNRCDLLTENANGQWLISSGGYGDWQVLGTFNTPLKIVEFGRFDPNETDRVIGATRPTTHAFKREQDGQWYVTKLTIPASPTPQWLPVASSNYEMDKFRFGDFTGDGVTDVVAVIGGRWSISESAAQTWRELNPTLGDNLKDLIIANMDHDDNIDDILRLKRKEVALPLGWRRVTLTWTRSKNGSGPWRPWKTYTFLVTDLNEEIVPTYGFAGRFGGSRKGGIVVLDHKRWGRFYSETAGAGAEWTSEFPY
ncbi:MAG TPA: hypothetical protein VJV03_04430 [Pyrinomonadaceae bacterium]|nr:hypothetical protein [Pyrinomonadaceae bacterium]